MWTCKRDYDASDLPDTATDRTENPPDFIERRFNSGFEHALKGGQLTQVEYFRCSFRLGFRAAKLYLREVRRARGILELPFRGRARVRTIWG